MFKRTQIAVAFVLLSLSAAAVVACSEDASTPVGGGTRSTNPLDPGNDGGPVPRTDGGPTPGTDGGACPNKPAGCFCGTPTTQKQFLNRCTNAAALPVTLTVPPATLTDLP